MTQQPPPYPPQPPPGGQPPMYVQPVMIAAGPSTSGWATAALVLGIIGALGGWCVLGIPCFIAVYAGHVGLKATEHGARGGRGQAVAGLILGYPFAALWAGTGILGIVGNITPFS